jgi:hypothetical protein
MTEDEARQLKKGDRVMVHVAGKWRPEVVVRLEDTWGASAGKYVAVRSRKPGRRPGGQLFKVNWYRSEEIRRAWDAVPANVYADFLEENGHPEAAALLRKHFPLADGRPG